MNWWNKLSDIGLSDRQDILYVRQVHILNRTLLLTCFFIGIYIPINLILRNYLFSLVEFIFLAFTCLAFYFHHRKWFRFSTYYIFILIIINLILAMIVHNDIGLEVLMISGSLGAFVMFRQKRDSLIVLFLLMFAFVFVQVLKNFISPTIVFEENFRIIFSYINILVSFLIIGAAIINFKFILENYEHTLLNQKEKIDDHNKEMIDSIKYAQRIQEAKMPEKKIIAAALPKSFILFKPKDIVSGDFYFFDQKENKIFIAAADCTGHGVPGALMSMLSSEKLHDALLQNSDISEILVQVNKGIKTSLRQSDTDSFESTKDGMDIALCFIDLENRIVKYGGANRPLWIIRKEALEVEEINPTRLAIGGFTKETQYFQQHEFKLKEGDTFYIFTDGYSDQFNGPGGRKLMSKKFKEILFNIRGMKMDEQEKYLDNFIEDWKAGATQVDDILVIGVRM